MSSITLDTRTFAVPGANEFTKPAPFTILVISILIVWVLIDLITRFVFNFSYNTLGLDSTSTIHSLLVLVFMVVFLILTVWVVDQYGLVEGGLAGSVAGTGAPLVQVDTSSTTVSTTTPIRSPSSDLRNGVFVSEK